MEEASVASGAFVVTPASIASRALSLAALLVQARLTWAWHCDGRERQEMCERK